VPVAIRNLQMNTGTANRLIVSLTWLVVAVWTLVLGALLGWSLHRDEQETMATAYAEARANLNKDITLRRWVTDHGGVYVPITEKQQSVPWLSHVPGRDVTTTDGRQLTLLNPASVVRQMMDRYAQDYGVRGRITGLKYLNPGNAPDSWEKLQLEAFVRGQQKEVWEVADLDGQPHLRYLREMMMEPGCEKCHAVLGYKLGDMRGATGLNLPLAGYYEQIRLHRRDIWIAYGSIWVFGLAGIRFSSGMARRRARELSQSKAIVDSTDDAIVSETLDGTIKTWNPAAERMFGYTAEEIIGGSMQILIPPDRTHEESEIRARISRGERIDRFETVRRRKDGRLMDVSATISPMLDEKGKIVGASKIVHDITERKQAELEIRNLNATLEERVRQRTAELSQARDAAETANIAKSAFLANMSHEIRTPMNGIIGMANILRREGITPQQAKRLDTIDASAQHLLSVINDVLDVSKIEAGKFTLEEATVVVSSLMSNVSSILSERVKDKGLHLLIETEHLPHNLVGDPTRLQQALLNYATNAVKFTEKGTVTLRALKQEETAEDIVVRFEVTDTGIGIAPEAMSRLFATFEQADNSMTRKYGGTGLGLAITKRLAELMGGKVGADSTPGVGSRFWFTVRLKKGAALVATPATTEADAETILRQRYCGRRVLVVDDEPINREVALMQLEAVDLVVDSAEDGAEAVTLAQETAYVAIFMDMQMPKVNGVEATQQIRRLPGHRDTPIIAMTANAFAEDKAECLAAGMNDFLIKPFNPDQLFAILLRALSQRDV
jgi:PAS domain S-box-containing protein